MTTPKRGVQVQIVYPMGPDTPVKVIRRHAPRHGGRTLAVFTHRDGRGVENANAYIEEKGLTLV